MDSQADPRTEPPASRTRSAVPQPRGSRPRRLGEPVETSSRPAHSEVFSGDGGSVTGRARAGFGSTNSPRSSLVGTAPQETVGPACGIGVDSQLLESTGRPALATEGVSISVPAGSSRSQPHRGAVDGGGRWGVYHAGNDTGWA